MLVSTWDWQPVRGCGGGATVKNVGFFDTSKPISFVV